MPVWCTELLCQPLQLSPEMHLRFTKSESETEKSPRSDQAREKSLEYLGLLELLHLLAGKHDRLRSLHYAVEVNHIDLVHARCPQYVLVSRIQSGWHSSAAPHGLLDGVVVVCGEHHTTRSGS